MEGDKTHNMIVGDKEQRKVKWEGAGIWEGRRNRDDMCENAVRGRGMMVHTFSTEPGRQKQADF